MNVKSCDDRAHSSMDRTIELPQNYQIVKTPYGGNDPEESIDGKFQIQTNKLLTMLKFDCD